MSKRKIVLTLTAPLILVAACAQEGSDPADELTVATDDLTDEVSALYRVGEDEVHLATRRVVKKIDETDGLRTEMYLPADPDAAEFEVEVRAVDLERGVELLARGDRVSFESDGPSAADEGHAMALFAEAMRAMETSDAAIQTAERRALAELGEAASTQPGFDSPVLEPYADVDQGCLGEIGAMYFTQTSVKVSGKVECLRGGTMKFALCIRRRALPSIGSQLKRHLLFPAAQLKKTVLEQLVGTEDCRETPEQEYDSPPQGTSYSLAFDADVFCGSLGERYSYTPSLKSVRDFNAPSNLFLGDDWHTLAKGPPVIHICGATF